MATLTAPPLMIHIEAAVPVLPAKPSRRSFLNKVPPEIVALLVPEVALMPGGRRQTDRRHSAVPPVMVIWLDKLVARAPEIKEPIWVSPLILAGSTAGEIGVSAGVRQRAAVGRIIRRNVESDAVSVPVVLTLSTPVDP
ncbi:MAG: hypothetical protein IPF57_14615 [Gammaproteobacteria bacterium]|nr:hypothetical protein [Gammaproteobacteria bacterium]